MLRSIRDGRDRRTSWDPSNNRNRWALGGASSLSCVINLMNTIIGSGLLASPHAMSQMGILVGSMAILWSGLMAAFGLYLQTRCARYLERVVFDAAIAIKCFGVGVSYLIIIGDLMPGVILGFNRGAASVPFLIDRQFWITAFMIVVIPLAFLRRLDSLKYTSVVALLSIGYLVILVLYYFLKGDTRRDIGEIRVIAGAGLVPTLKSFPVIVFAYTCHQNMFSILNEIKDNSPRRTTSVIITSIGSAASLYILVAITGYLSFGNSVSGNIVGMYIPSTASTVGKAAIVLLVTFSYPLQVHPCRASVDAVLKWRPNNMRSLRNSPNGSPARLASLIPGASAQQPLTRKDAIGEVRFATITAFIIILSYVVAMTVSSLDKVLAYVGSTGSTSISFILPGLFYYKISAPDSIHHQRLIKVQDEDGSDSEEENGGMRREDAKFGSWRKTILRKLSLALTVYGFFVMGVCLGINLFAGPSH